MKTNYYYSVNLNAGIWELQQQYSMGKIDKSTAYICAQSIADTLNKSVRLSETNGFNNWGLYFIPNKVN